MNEKLVVILNPASGSAGEDLHATIETALHKRGAEFEIRETTRERSGGEMAAVAVREGATHIVACGGDGTVMSVVNGIGKSEAEPPVHDAAAQEKADLRQPQVTLSIIPRGTANLLAAALGIPTDTEEAISVALAGQDRLIDLGRCGKFLFALGLGLGLTERFVAQSTAEEKEKLGRWAYVWALVKELGARPNTFTYRLDDQAPRKQRGVAIGVLNVGQVSNVQLAPDAKMDDGLLDVFILHRFYLRDVLRMAWRTLFGKLDADRAISFHQARRVEIRSDPPLDLQIDGEVVDLMTPLIAEVIPQAVRVRVPLSGG
jgi:YegS/Rv2252/BmrU family lipid kinase